MRHLFHGGCTEVYSSHIQKGLVVPCHVEQNPWPFRGASWHNHFHLHPPSSLYSLFYVSQTLPMTMT